MVYPPADYPSIHIRLLTKLVKTQGWSPIQALTRQCSAWSRTSDRPKYYTTKPPTNRNTITFNR